MSGRHPTLALPMDTTIRSKLRSEFRCKNEVNNDFSNYFVLGIYSTCKFHPPEWFPFSLFCYTQRDQTSQIACHSAIKSVTGGDACSTHSPDQESHISSHHFKGVMRLLPFIACLLHHLFGRHMLHSFGEEIRIAECKNYPP